MSKLLIICCLLLAGCEGSVIWSVTHPDKQVVKVDGLNVSIVPRGNGQYDAWSTEIASNAPLMKARQIRAVEQAFNCKVSAAEYMPATALLQTMCN